MQSTPLRIELRSSAWPGRLRLSLAALLLLVPWAAPAWPVMIVVGLAICGLWWPFRQAPLKRSLLLEADGELADSAAASLPSKSADGLRQARIWLGTLVLQSRNQTIVLWPDMLDPHSRAALRAWLQLHPPAQHPRMLLS